MKRITRWLICGTSLCSCGGTADLGNGADETAVTASGGSQSMPGGPLAGAGGADCTFYEDWSGSTTEDGVMQFAPSEVWRGYTVGNVEGVWDSDQVTLYVEARTATSISGAVVFASGELPPPATDPDVGYPPGAYTGVAGGANGFGFWKGYALSMRQAVVDGARIRFDVMSGEQYKRWCELQPAYAAGDGFFCVNGNLAQQAPEGCAVGTEWTDMTPIDCGKLDLCMRPACSCLACGCTASTGSFGAFDLRLEGDELSGFVGNLPVFLTRDLP
jgi:hypothetical protein